MALVLVFLHFAGELAGGKSKPKSLIGFGNIDNEHIH